MVSIKFRRIRVSKEVVDQVRAVAQPVSIVIIAYLGFILGNPLITVASLAVLVIYLAYTLSWYITTVDTINRLQTPTFNGIFRVGDRVRFKPPPGLDIVPIVSRHINYINGELVFRWSGSARILGFVIKAKDELTGLSAYRFRLVKATIPVRFMEVGEGFYAGRLAERGMDEYRGLIEYDFTKPASSIHWPTSAKVGSLIAKEYAEEATRLTVAIPAIPDVLVAGDDLRPIDRILKVLEDVASKYGQVNVILVGLNMSESVIINKDTVHTIEGILVDMYSGLKNRSEAERLSRILGVSEDDALWVVYPDIKPSGNWGYFVNSASAQLAILPAEASRYVDVLKRRGVDVVMA